MFRFGRVLGEHPCIARLSRFGVDCATLCRHQISERETQRRFGGSSRGDRSTFRFVTRERPERCVGASPHVETARFSMRVARPMT